MDTELAGKVPPSQVPLPHGNVEVNKQLRIAAMLASTPDEFRANLRVLMPPQDAEQLAASAEHFRRASTPGGALRAGPSPRASRRGSRRCSVVRSSVTS